MATFDEVYSYIEKLGRENHRYLVMAIVRLEKGISDPEMLDRIYSEYLRDDGLTLLNDEFDELIYRCSAMSDWGWGETV
ncbi:hypothetical protein [Bacteroides heparinolyticus]|uniref:hypothetical protein n=1 Tax=Prevotella heparinolytica TaxID=28113 RepID=UPI00359F63F0